MRAKPDGATVIAIFLSMPLIGTPIMLAISAEFLRVVLPASKTRVSDIIALSGFLIAYHLALALVFVAWSVEYTLLWCVTAWPINYAFCQFALISEE